MPNIVFTTRLTEADWDDTLRAWRCPPLAVPGAIIEALYADGSKIDTARYEVLKDQAVIRWTPSDQPQRVAATVRLTEDLTLGAETDRWKRLAIVLPVVATIVSAGIAGAATYFSKAAHDVKPIVTDKPSSLSPWMQSYPVTVQQTPQPTDNSHIGGAKELKFGQTEPGIATQDQSWFKFISDNAGPQSIRVFVRNVKLSGSMEVRVYDTKETEIKLGSSYDDNINLEFIVLKKGYYYIMIRTIIVSGTVRYEMVVTGQ